MRGEVILLIDALLPEVLIHRAREMGIVFRWIESAPPDGLLAGVSAADARRLQALCARYNIPLRVLSRRGGNALMTWFRRRWTLAASLLAFCLVCWLCLTHIWRVDVTFTGPSMEMGDPAQVREELEELGIRPGMDRDIDPVPLADALAARLPGMSFVGVKLEGVRLRVEAAPEVPAPQVYDADVPTDLTACRGGIVTGVTVEAGEPRVKPGDTVLPGQLLIRGEERDTQDAMRPVAARGEVTIRTWFEGSAEGSLTSGETRRTGRYAVSAELAAPWGSLPLKEAEDFARQEVVEETIPIGGLYLPVMIRRRTLWETRQVDRPADPEELAQRLASLAMADARSALAASGPDEYKIARGWTRLSHPDGDTLRAAAVVEITMNAAIPRKGIPEEEYGFGKQPGNAQH